MEPSIEKSAAPRTRVASLDIFRGLTIFAMIIVNSPGDYRHVYSPLEHVDWDGLSPTDLVFPFFLFIVGVGMVASRSRQAPQDPASRTGGSGYFRLAQRALTLVALGLFLNGFPGFDLSTWRIPGVLQRIGVCSLIAGLIIMHVPLRWQWVLGAAVLGSYAAVLNFVGAPGVMPGQLEPTANLPRWVDLTVFTPSHVFPYWPTEPEGILSTPAAVVTVLIGCWFGYAIIGRSPATRNGLFLLMVGVLGVALGWAWGFMLPMIKMIWTPSYVLGTAGWALMCFGVIYLLADVRPAPKWAWIVNVFGRNAILAYVLSELAIATLGSLHIGEMSVPEYLTKQMHQAGMSMELSSLAYALSFTFAIWLVLLVPYRRKWFVRV